MTSYIQLLNKIEAFCLAHKQIQKYGGEFREQMPNFSTKDTKYPMVFVSPSGGAPLYDTNEITLDIYCVDIIQKGRENLNTIVSDCHLILTDLYIYFSQGSDLSIDVLGTPSQNPLNNLDLDYVAGWMMTITFQVEGWCVAAIPMGDIPSGQGCEDATYSNSDNSYSGSVLSGGSLSIPDITVTDSDGSTFTSPSVKNITCTPAADANVQNSDATYSTTVASGGTLTLPDSQINVNGVDEGDVVSVKTIDVNIQDSGGVVTPDSVSLVGNTLTVTVPAGGAAPVGAKPIKTGQTTSYTSEDDGATQRGRLVDFFTLDSNNAFGNLNRFTDLTGGQTYASNGVFLDHSTDNGSEILAFTNSPTNTTWSVTITAISAQTTDGKTDWYMPNVQELNLLVNEAANPNLNWSPLNVVATPFSGNIYSWTSTTPISNTARAKAFYSSNATDGNEMRTRAKTLGVRSLACRYYTYSELGI